MKWYLVVVGSLIGLSPSSWAQVETHVLNTMYVAASSAEELLQHSQALSKFQHELLYIPFNKTHLSEAILAQQDIQRIDQALHQVSGVFHQNNYGGGLWDNYSFRGFQANPNMGADNLRNGLSVNRGLSAPRDLVNIEALDFLKGPSAALYGRGEVGGLLNITTKKPTWQSETEIYLHASSLDDYRMSVEHSAPVNDEVAYRLAIAWEDQQSFRDHVSSQRLFFAPQLSWHLSPDTQLALDGEFTQHLGTFDRGITAVDQQLLMNPKTFTGEPIKADLSRQWKHG